MTDVSPFWQFCITQGPAILGTATVLAILATYGARRLPLSDSKQYRYEMRIRTSINALFFLAALATFYEAMHIGGITTALVEMNAPYYEGGQGATPVATQEELAALSYFMTRANYLALAAFLLSIAGWALQYRRMRRYRQHEATDPRPNSNLYSSV